MYGSMMYWGRDELGHDGGGHDVREHDVLGHGGEGRDELGHDGGGHDVREHDVLGHGEEVVCDEQVDHDVDEHHQHQRQDFSHLLWQKDPYPYPCPPSSPRR